MSSKFRNGNSSHCEIFEVITRDPRFGSLIDHDKNHNLWNIVSKCYHAGL